MRGVVAQEAEGDPAFGRGGGRVIRLHACLHAGRAPGILDAALDADAVARRVRMRRADDRAAFNISRALAKLALSEASAGDPRRVRLPTAAGKPTAAGCGTWRYSLSRTRGLVAVAVSEMQEVGVDVERVDPSIPHQELSYRHFAPAEARALERLPGPEGREAFFRLWTCKEALGKATGGGIASTVDMDLSRVLREGQVRAPGGWMIRSFACSDDCIGSVASMSRVVIERRERSVDEIARAWGTT